MAQSKDSNDGDWQMADNNNNNNNNNSKDSKIKQDDLNQVLNSLNELNVNMGKRIEELKEQLQTQTERGLIAAMDTDNENNEEDDDKEDEESKKAKGSIYHIIMKFIAKIFKNT